MLLKELPGDFFVREVMDVPLGGGPFLYFVLRKCGWGTFDAVRRVARMVRVPLKDVGYAGNKDKQAVTEQFISVLNVTPEVVDRLTFPEGISLKYVGCGKERISLGDHRGNFFRIVVRDVEKKVVLKVGRVKNVFDAQRFGMEGNNFLVGKALVQGRFADACKRLRLPFESRDLVGVLRRVDRKMLRLYISAYQSWLWNRVVEEVEDEEEIPLVGFLTRFKSERVKRLYEELLAEEGVRLDDFRMRRMPELANEGDVRRVWVVVNNFSAKWSRDERRVGRWRVTVSFQLPKGVYATWVVKSLFSGTSGG